jgi:acyl carrier protein
MTPQEISKRIQTIVTCDLAIADESEIDVDTNLIAEGFLDSINAMRLVSQIESKFETKIPPRDLIPSNFSSIAAISNYLTKNRNGT